MVHVAYCLFYTKILAVCAPLLVMVSQSGVAGSRRQRRLRQRSGRARAPPGPGSSKPGPHGSRNPSLTSEPLELSRSHPHPHYPIPDPPERDCPKGGGSSLGKSDGSRCGGGGGGAWARYPVREGQVKGTEEERERGKG